MLSSASRILGFNLLVLLLAALVLRLANHGREAGIGFGLLMIVAIILQMVVNLVLSFTTKDTPRRQAHWLSLLLVPLIGFGVCLGGLQSY